MMGERKNAITCNLTYKPDPANRNTGGVDLGKKGPGQIQPEEMTCYESKGILGWDA